jgi:hypothetical protein
VENMEHKTKIAIAKSALLVGAIPLLL